MYFDIFSDKYKNLEKYNYWFISKYNFDLIKKHITYLQFFDFETNNFIDNIIKDKYDINKKLIINTEYQQDFQSLYDLIIKHSSLKFNNQNIESFTIYDFFIKLFNIKLDDIYYILDKNINMTELKNTFDILGFTPKIIFNDDFEIIKQKIIIESKKNNLKYVMILDSSFIFNKTILENLYNKNININIPDNFNELYLDYYFEQNNFRYNQYILDISNYNMKKSCIININSSSYKYFGIYPILNKNLNKNKDVLIKKYNYMKNKYLFQTLLINLDRRPDRFQKYIENFGDVYPNIIRFSAIDGKTFDFSNYMNLFDISEYNKYKNIKNPYQSHRYLKGVLGCSMSHYTIWNILNNNNNITDNDYILVLEDDIILVDNFNEKLNNLLDYIHFDYEWDVIFLGFHDYKNFNDTKINNMLLKFSGDLRLNGGGTFAYFIRKKAARKYLDFIQKYNMQQAIDWFMIEFFDKMTVYKCEPELVLSPMANNSNIDSDIQNLNETINF